MARDAEKALDFYVNDLIWSIANRYYEEDLPRPSVIRKEGWKSKPVDNRTGQQIIDEVLNKLGGE